MLSVNLVPKSSTSVVSCDSHAFKTVFYSVITFAGLLFLVKDSSILCDETFLVRTDSFVNITSPTFTTSTELPLITSTKLPHTKLQSDVVSVHESIPTFSEYLDDRGFNRTDLMKGPHPHKHYKVAEYLRHLSKYAALMPLHPIEVDKRPEPLKELQCNDFWGPGPRKKPKHIVDIILFGYELDLLEIRLFELWDVVDEFVICEGFYSDRMSLKPLLFAENRNRFKRFDKKIIHLVQDDADVKNMNSKVKDELTQDQSWGNENRRRVYCRNQYMQNKGWTYEGREKWKSEWENILLIVGDIDEIPQADSINHVKNCKTDILMKSKDRAHQGISFYTTLFSFDLDHVSGTELWSQPIVSIIGGPLRHARDHMVPKSFTGAHFNRCTGPIGLMFKRFCLAEEGKLFFPYDVNKEWATAWCLRVPTPREIDREKDGIWIPWFAKHNPKRFPLLFPRKFPKQKPWDQSPNHYHFTDLASTYATKRHEGFTETNESLV